MSASGRPCSFRMIMKDKRGKRKKNFPFIAVALIKWGLEAADGHAARDVAPHVICKR